MLFSATVLCCLKYGYGSNVTLSMDRTGHVKVEGLIFDNAMEQSLTFAFEADQSTLPPLISGLKNMIS